MIVKSHKDILVTPQEFVKPMEDHKVLGFVKGFCVVDPNYFCHNYDSSSKNTKKFNEYSDMAIDNMCEEAQKLGANAVICFQMKTQISNVAVNSFVTIIEATGLAIKYN